MRKKEIKIESFFLFREPQGELVFHVIRGNDATDGAILVHHWSILVSFAFSLCALICFIQDY